MENTTTRISDLPDPNSQHMQHRQQQLPPNQQQPTKPSELPNNYTPINVHPNPYGVSDQNPIMSHPEQPISPQQEVLSNNTATQQIPQYLSEEQREMIMPSQQQRLPSVIYNKILPNTPKTNKFNQIIYPKEMCRMTMLESMKNSPIRIYRSTNERTDAINK